MSETILYNVQDAVGRLTLNRPDKLNAFTDDMLRRLAEILKQAARDDGVRCLVLLGEGRAFSAGQDLASVRERASAGGMRFRDHLTHAYNPVIRRIRHLEKPVIAGVNGVAAGAGASLALACDMRIAAASASFIQAFSKVGLIPDSGSTWALPRLVGYPRAFELAVTGRRVGAEEALAMGLVNRVVPDEALADALDETARALAAGPTRAIGLTKRAMNRALLTDLDAALEYEAMLQEIAGGTDDHAEGVAAFLEKRPPEFTGT